MTNIRVRRRSSRRHDNTFPHYDSYGIVLAGNSARRHCRRWSHRHRFRKVSNISFLHTFGPNRKARFLLAEKAFGTIDIWEQRDNVGGIWNLSSPEKSRRIPIPQINPRYGQSSEDQAHNSLEFESPLYNYLETNIPKQLMAFTEKPFDETDSLFPTHQRVLEYLEEHAKDVVNLVHFQHQVCDLDLDKSSTSDCDVWQMQVENLSTGNISTHLYDAVVVANGHFVIPSVPQIDGLGYWNLTYPNSVLHSKGYRKPEEFTGMKVLVIGNSASGLDVAYQVSQYAQQPVLLSSRSASIFASALAGASPPPWRKDVPQIAEFLPPSTHDRGVRFNDGHVEEHIDRVVFCTGYFYSMPFMSNFKPPIITDGLRTQDVYYDLFHIEHPSLVLPVINQRVIPFPLAENQAAVVARVWSGRLNLPSQKIMRQWEEDAIKENGNGKYFHLKPFPADCAHMNELYRWAKSASRRSDLDNNGQGRLGRGNDEHVTWLRSRFPQIKSAYQSRGSERNQVTTTGELGFDFEKWLKEASDEDREIFAQAKCEYSRC
jgi:cation diffusion facilitator CzcD-associated flavoprotein CzcO